MEFYRPFAQESWPFLKIVVRSPLPTETITRSVKTALRGIDPSLALIWPQPFSEILAEALGRSEEHTSELQSQSNLVCRLLLEKKKINDLSYPLDFHLLLFA